MVSRLIWPLIILQIATVVAIVLFLRMLLHKQLELGIKRIKKLDEENLKKEALLNERLQRLDKECTMKLGEAEQEARTLIDAAKEELKKMREEERVRAKEEAKRIIAGGLQEKEKLMKESRQDIFDKAVIFAQQVLRRMFSEKDLEGLRGKISKEVVDFLAQSKQIDELLADNKSVEIITAAPLTEEHKKGILKIIKDKAKSDLDVKFNVDKDAIGGLVLKIGKQVIDGSITYRINQTAQEVKEEIR